MHDLLINELRSKAEYFEQYIIEKFLKIQEQRHVSTNTEPATNGHIQEQEEKCAKQHTNNQIIDLEVANKQSEMQEEDEREEESVSNTDLMIKERNIREQLAEKYTLEIKTIEMSYNKKMSELQKEATANISTLKELLETKAREIEVMKKFIITERAKVTEILQSRESEVVSLNEEKRKLQEEFRELREKANDMKQMLDKSHTKNVKLKADLEKLTNEMTRQQEHASKAMTEMGEQLRELDKKTTNIQTQYEQLRDKYRSVKKTALIYKEYASKKDAHVESELERIKSHYETEVARLHDKLQRLVKKGRELQVNEKISKMQSEFDAMVSEVNSAT